MNKHFDLKIRYRDDKLMTRYCKIVPLYREKLRANYKLIIYFYQIKFFSNVFSFFLKFILFNYLLSIMRKIFQGKFL